MFLKSMSLAVFGALLVAAGGTRAAEYRPDDFLTLDLSKAVLSPTPLGPRNQFVPWSATAKADSKADSKGDSKADAKTSSKSDDKTEESRASQVRVMPERVARSYERALHAFSEKPGGAARARLAHHHGNPLDARAQAMDRHIQTWPCRSGGICNWKQVPSEARGD
jgi:hypothetical protein